MPLYLPCRVHRAVPTSCAPTPSTPLPFNSLLILILHLQHDSPPIAASTSPLCPFLGRRLSGMAQRLIGVRGAAGSGLCPGKRMSCGTLSQLSASWGPSFLLVLALYYWGAHISKCWRKGGRGTCTAVKCGLWNETAAV